MQASGCLSGIPTGFKSLDEVITGLKKNDLIVIGGQPASGKTAMAMSIMLNVAVDQNLPVLYISLESSALELSKRIIRMRSGISNEKLYGISKLEPSEWMQLESKMKGVENAPIFIEERPNLTIGHIRNIVRTQIEKNGIRLVIIDYMQLIKGRVDCRINREQEMSSISRELKSLAKECQVPIVAISSLSRQLSNRQNTNSNSRPQISDLRDSGSIEFESDVIPQLMDLAYNRYASGKEFELSNLNSAQNLLSQMANADQNYLNGLFNMNRANRSDFESDRNFDEGVRQYDESMDYQKERDKVADEQWLKSFEEGVREYEKSYGLSLAKANSSSSSKAATEEQKANAKKIALAAFNEALQYNGDPAEWLKQEYIKDLPITTASILGTNQVASGLSNGEIIAQGENGELVMEELLSLIKDYQGAKAKKDYDNITISYS